MTRMRAGMVALAILAAVVADGTVAAPAAERYVHPDAGFSFAVPEGSTVNDTAAENMVVLTLPQGERIDLRYTTPGDPTTISERAALLEFENLGKNKPWRRKTDQRLIFVADLLAFSAVYAGKKQRHRVVITRAQRRLFEFVFSAPDKSFDATLPDFEAFLGSFILPPDDRPPPVVPPSVTTPPAAATPPPPPKEARAPAMRRFTDPKLGYEIAFPADWILERPSWEVVLFSGPHGTEAYETTVSIQNISPPGAESPMQAASLALDQFRDQFLEDTLGISEVAVVQDAPYLYRRNGVLLVGRDMVIDYRHEGQRLRQWTVVLPRPAGPYAHVWSYRAPAELFARFMPKALAILESWALNAEPPTSPEKKGK